MGQAKLERALKRGGVAQRDTSAGYRVWRCRNRQRRSLGTLPTRIGDSLRADGKLRPVRGEVSLYEWAGPVEDGAKVAALPASVLHPLQPRRTRRRGLLVRALETAEDARARARLSDAAARFLSDTEQMMQPGRVTMNWAQLAAGRTETGPRSLGNLPGYASARAKARMEQLARALDEEVLQLLGWALVQEFSAAELARRRQVRPARAVELVANALRALADAYDRVVAIDR